MHFFKWEDNTEEICRKNAFCTGNELKRNKKQALSDNWNWEMAKDVRE